MPLRWFARKIRAPAIARCGQPARRLLAHSPGAGDVAGVQTKTMAPNTGRFSTQLAWARIARRYQSAPSTRSARKPPIGTRPVRIRLQRYTPTVASNNNTVQAANPTSISTGTVIGRPHRVTYNVGVGVFLLLHTYGVPSLADEQPLAVTSNALRSSSG